MRLQELQEKRNNLAVEMRGINEKAEAESRDYTDAEDTRHKALKSEIAGLDRKIERARDVAEAERAAPAILHSGRVGDGKYEDRARQFSLVKAINARCGEDVDVGFEREISSEVARRTGRKFAGIALPNEYFEKRVLTTGAGAASLYPEQHRGDLFIDTLRAKLVVGQLGATVLDNLVGDQDIPRQTGSAPAEWVAEDSALTGGDATFDDVTMSPKTIGSMTSYSRRTLINAVPSIENIVRDDLSSVIANGIDRAALRGDGSGNSPTGVLSANGAAAATLAGPTWAQVLDFISAIQMANADVGTLGWAMAPDSVAKLRATTKVTSDAGAGFLMDTPTEMAGYRVATTTALSPSGSPDKSVVLFGAWSQLLVGYWSATDILVNPFDSTGFPRGRVLVRAMRDVDVAVRHGASFAVASDLVA